MPNANQTSSDPVDYHTACADALHTRQPEAFVEKQQSGQVSYHPVNDNYRSGYSDFILFASPLMHFSGFVIHTTKNNLICKLYLINYYIYWQISPMIITRTFTVPRKFYPRIIMVDSLVKRLKGDIRKTRTDRGCLYTIYFTTADQAELFDQLMGSILPKSQLL